MCQNAVISLKKRQDLFHEPAEEKRTPVEIFHGKVVHDGEVIPQHAVGDSVRHDLVLARCHRSMTHLACKGRITAEHTICVDFAAGRGGKMSYTLMDSIEKSLTVKGTAFEYDGKLHHLFFLNRDTRAEHIRYILREKPMFPIL